LCGIIVGQHGVPAPRKKHKGDDNANSNPKAEARTTLGNNVNEQPLPREEQRRQQARGNPDSDLDRADHGESTPSASSN
jgi:hypothetical protein